MTIDEINKANRASAEREAQPDWAKEERRVELLTEERFGYRPAHPRYFPEDPKEDILSQIERENITASNNA